MNPGRLRVLFGVALALVALLDFTQRIFVPRDVQPRDAASFVPADVAPPVAAAAVATQLATWLPGLKPVGAAVGSGDFADTDWTLKLLAVFSDRTASFAVLQATPMAGGAARVQRVQAGDEVYGFKVASIQPQVVMLESAQGQQELQVFKPAGSSVKGIGAPPSASVRGPATAQADVTGTTGVAPSPTAQSTAAVTPAVTKVPATAPAAGSGPKQVTTTELQPGQAFELPASMRGLKVVEAPVPPQKSGSGAKSARPQPPPAPQNP